MPTSHKVTLGKIVQELERRAAGKRPSPVMVRVAWAASVAIDDLPVYWSHVAHQVWWVLGECLHFKTPIMKRRIAGGAPKWVACYECQRQPKVKPVVPGRAVQLRTLLKQSQPKKQGI